MKFRVFFVGFLSFFLFGRYGFAQISKDLALEKAEKAIQLEDEEGKYDEAIKLFAEAEKLDPDKFDYPYEMAYALSKKKEYPKAIKILEGLLDHPNVTARAYQALGNAYDFNNQPAKAIETYENGLKRFPDAGELYLERGNMDLFKKDYENALSYYEQGIKLDPKFPSNYYWASIIYCSSSEEVWGMIYGEIFMNLERNSKRTAEISKLLFDTYKSGIQFTSDTSMTVSFSQSIILDSEAL
ncbi:MAG: tetratricopeptide repeat protein, partial [Chitinophagaceae bacterium]